MEVYTIGFTEKSAQEFFERLKKAKVRRLMDVRLRNVSQLAGFSKRDDLCYFLREICGMEYVHEPLLAPSAEILDAYKKSKGSWEEYERLFRQLMEEREIEKYLSPADFETPTVLLCSEATPENCHRRLVLEYLQEHWGGLEIRHL